MYTCVLYLKKKLMVLKYEILKINRPHIAFIWVSPLLVEFRSLFFVYVDFNVKY